MSSISNFTQAMIMDLCFFLLDLGQKANFTQIYLTTHINPAQCQIKTTVMTLGVDLGTNLN